jgi:hypothetical protein
MLTWGEVDRLCDERDRVHKAAEVQRLGGDWLGTRMFDTGPATATEAEMLRREVSRGPAERDDPGPAAGLTPTQILRELQQQQVTAVVTARLPGPHGWAALELGLPGGPPPGPDRAVKGGVTPLHSACEAGVDSPDDEEDQADEDRRRVQHLADPWSDPAEAPEMAKQHPKVYAIPAGYPVPATADPADFRRPALTAGQPAPSPDQSPPHQPLIPPVALASVPEATLAALRRPC